MSYSEGVKDIWVSTSEAAEMTGYSQDHVRKLARDNSKLAESERLIKIRKRSHGYELWLPDLLNYAEKYGLGPFRKDSE